MSFEYISKYELKKGTEGASGYDIASDETVTLKPDERRTISTSLYVAIPYGYTGIVAGRSGLAFVHDVAPVNTGIIDSDYRGEVKVRIHNLSMTKEYNIKKGDNIAQLLVLKSLNKDPKKVTSLNETKRGSKRFGSTDKK